MCRDSIQSQNKARNAKFMEIPISTSLLLKHGGCLLKDDCPVFMLYLE